MMVDALRRGEFPDRARALRIAARLLRAGQPGNAARIARATLPG